MTRYKVYEDVPGEVSIADESGWLPGIYDTKETAVFVMNNASIEMIERRLTPIYSFFGENRPVTTADFNWAWALEQVDPTPEPEPGPSAEEKLAKIEELLHPGFWSTYDYRREAILAVLGTGRTSWHKEPEEYAGR